MTEQHELKIISIAGIEIGIYNSGPVGVLVSGGADSALLLYVIMKHVTQPIHVYSSINTGIVKEQGPAFDNVVETCSRLTNNNNFVVHKNVLDVDDSSVFFKMCNDALESKEVDILYSGVTVFPDHAIWSGWPLTSNFEENYNVRSPGVKHSLFGIKDFGGDPNCTLDHRLYKPWINYNKQHIASMFRELDIESELYPITRSCESSTIVVKNCGECWWCRERIWGFGYLE
jgi:hypothetical protein